MEKTSYISYYLDWHHLAVKTLEADIINAKKLIPAKGIAIAGMGGSGIAADVIYELLKHDSNIPITIVKDFDLPAWIDNEWVVLAISYSGNTLETLSVVNESLNKGAKVVSVTSGGKLAEISIEKKLPLLLIEAGRAPRASFPALLLGSLKVLATAGFGVDLDRVTGELDKLRRVNKAQEIAEKLATFLHDKIPVFVTDQHHYPLALRAKDEFNENAKMLALTHVYPESAHNDIVAWEKWIGPIATVVLRESGNEILKYVSEYMREVGVPVYEIVIDDVSEYVSRILWWSLVIGLASVKLAEIRNVDPEETESIRRYKQFVRNIVMK